MRKRTSKCENEEDLRISDSPVFAHFEFCFRIFVFRISNLVFRISSSALAQDDESRPVERMAVFAFENLQRGFA